MCLRRGTAVPGGCSVLQAQPLCSICAETNAHGHPLNWEVPAEGSGLCSRCYRGWTMRCRGFLPFWNWKGHRVILCKMKSERPFPDSSESRFRGGLVSIWIKLGLAGVPHSHTHVLCCPLPPPSGLGSRAHMHGGADLRDTWGSP